MTEFITNDGGRTNAGFKPGAGDCVTRAITIATDLPYIDVYNTLGGLMKAYTETKRDRIARSMRRRGQSTARDGVHREVYEPWLLSLGWKYTATMGFGTGCRVHLKAEELPKGRLIVQVSKHLVAVIDGVIHDTYDPSRDGTRCVYGYYQLNG